MQVHGITVLYGLPDQLPHRALALAHAGVEDVFTFAQRGFQQPFGNIGALFVQRVGADAILELRQQFLRHVRVDDARAVLTLNGAGDARLT